MSSHISAMLESHYYLPPSRIMCAYAGSNIPPTDCKTYIQRAESKNILFVGIDWERKGGEILRTAFDLVLQVHPDAHLTVIGCTPPFDSPSVSVLGLLPSHSLPKYYSSANIFCMPTLHEPFGIAFLEAMSFSLPVVSTSIGALVDMVDPSSTGYLVSPGDPNALADKLIYLLSHPDIAVAFGLAGRRRLDERYSWSSVANKLATTIRK